MELDLAGNELLRRPQLRGAPVGAIDDIVIVADHQGTTAVDLADGSELWSRADLVATELVVTGDALLGLDGPGGQLERIDPRDGTTRWTADIGVTTGFDAAMVDGTVHVTTSLASALPRPPGSLRRGHRCQHELIQPKSGEHQALQTSHRGGPLHTPESTWQQ